MKVVASPPSLCRGLACIIGIFGAFMANRIPLLLGGLFIVLIFMGVQGKLREFFRFARTILLPIATLLVLIWGLVRRGAPGGEQSLAAGMHYAAVITLRLAVAGAIFLATVLTLSPERLIQLLRAFGVRGWALAIIVSRIHIWTDFQDHVKKIYVARCGRGLMGDRALITRLRQLPNTLNTLVISSLNYSLERAHTWRTGGLIERLDRLSCRSAAAEDCSEVSGALVLGLSIVWAITAIIYFFR